jgi:isoleucyl-tRNA synthetase
MIMAADGQKLSKRLKNYPAVDEVFDNEGADSLRLYLMSNNQAVAADYMRFNRDAMKDLSRNVQGTLLDSLKFFKMYSNIDGWRPNGLSQPDSDNLLDQWMLSRLHQTITVTTKNADDYRLAHAINPIFELIDDMSNWYIRRSRRRFWKSESDIDKEQAYATLFYTLVEISKLLAPWAPYIADRLWIELTSSMDAPKSVHLTDWTKAQKPNLELIDGMAKIREAVALGLSQRAEASIKVRQPLSLVKINGLGDVDPQLLDLIKDEVNVKKVVNSGSDKKSLEVELDVHLNDQLLAEGTMREIVRHIQNCRKNAELNVEDRIKLRIETTSDAINKSMRLHRDDIYNETLAVADLDGDGEYTQTVKVDTQEVIISLSKA